MNINTIKIQPNIEENMINFAQQIKEVFSRTFILIDNLWINNPDKMQNVFGDLSLNLKPFYDCIDFNGLNDLKRALENHKLLYFTTYKSDEENINEEDINNKSITEIHKSSSKSDKKDSAIITLSPINDAVLKCLLQNPEEIYQLTSREFEEVMAEIYNRLGYKVKLTKATRDGGKDIIIRKSDILGDFIYYVECKKYSTNNPVGVEIVRKLLGVINMERVNCGIIATTSYFTRGAKDLILKEDLDFQIKLHDNNMIRNLLNKVV